MKHRTGVETPHVTVNKTQTESTHNYHCLHTAYSNQNLLYGVHYSSPAPSHLLPELYVLAAAGVRCVSVAFAYVIAQTFQMQRTQTDFSGCGRDVASSVCARQSE